MDTYKADSSAQQKSISELEQQKRQLADDLQVPLLHSLLTCLFSLDRSFVQPPCTCPVSHISILIRSLSSDDKGKGTRAWLSHSERLSCPSVVHHNDMLCQPAVTEREALLQASGRCARARRGVLGRLATCATREGGVAFRPREGSARRPGTVRIAHDFFSRAMPQAASRGTAGSWRVLVAPPPAPPLFSIDSGILARARVREDWACRRSR